MLTISKTNSIITDSGFWIALFDERDTYHSAAKEALDTFSNQLFVVTWPVIVEVGHMLHQHAGWMKQFAFLQAIERGGADIFQLDDAEHLSRMAELMEKYRNLPMDVTDASMVILAEELGHGRILSTDERNFNAYRWKNHEPFENLLIKNQRIQELSNEYQSNPCL